MEPINEMELKFKSLSENESFARACVAGFCGQLNPTLDEITDIKTAVSEAVTNCVVHAYPNELGVITLKVQLFEDALTITVEDCGVGIKDIHKAREPFYTTKPNEERSGMGFTVMESFMDQVDVYKTLGKGITVKMSKILVREKCCKQAN